MLNSVSDIFFDVENIQSTEYFEFSLSAMFWLVISDFANLGSKLSDSAQFLISLKYKFGKSGWAQNFNFGGSEFKIFVEVRNFDVLLL